MFSVTQTNDFLHIPSQELRTQDYEQASKRLIAHDLHCTTLAEYFRLNRNPRGLRSHLQPTLLKENYDFCQRFESILNKCSLDLMVLTIEFLQKSIQDTKTDYCDRDTTDDTSHKKIGTYWKRRPIRSVQITTRPQRNEKGLNLYTTPRAIPQTGYTAWTTIHKVKDGVLQDTIRNPGSDSDHSTHSHRSPFLGVWGSRQRGRSNPFKPIRRAGRKHYRESQGNPQSDYLIPGRSSDTNLVINISSYNLTPIELNTLQKGLSFCPTPTLDTFTLQQELQSILQVNLVENTFCNSHESTIRDHWYIHHTIIPFHQ